MPDNDVWKRYLDAGMHFTQMTRERAEEFVRELVRVGEVQRERAEERIEELVERSRRNTEELLGYIRKEVATQIKAMGLNDLAKRARGAGEAAMGRTGAKPGPSAKTATSGPAKKATAKKATAKKSTAAKKASAKKAPAKKAAAKKAAGAKKA